MKDILVIAELLDGQVRSNTFAAVAAAKQLAAATGAAWDALLIGPGAAGATAGLQSFGARKLLTAEIDGGYVCERYAPTIAALAEQGSYAFVMATAGTYGKDLLPRAAAKLGAGMASDISAVHVDGEQVLFKRPMWAGNVFGTMSITTKIGFVTVRQSEFTPAAADASASASESQAVDVVEDATAARVRFVSLQTVASERPDLTEAKYVVSGGRALKSEENFATYIEPLADVLGAAIGATRAACDAGYVPNELQVGQTGKSVAPDLYFAVGISGAIQHLAGMKGSKTIVAINKNPEAPIREVADYFLTADLFKALPPLTDAIKKIKSAAS